MSIFPWRKKPPSNPSEHTIILGNTDRFLGTKTEPDSQQPPTDFEPPLPPPAEEYNSGAQPAVDGLNSTSNSQNDSTVFHNSSKVSLGGEGIMLNSENMQDNQPKNQSSSRVTNPPSPKSGNP